MKISKVHTKQNYWRISCLTHMFGTTWGNNLI